MSTATSLLDGEQSAHSLQRPVSPPVLCSDTTTEGIVLPAMADVDGATGPESSPSAAPEETDEELTARFERDAIPLLDQLYGAPCA